MITQKTKKELEFLREGGARLGKILRMVAASVQPGITTQSLDKLAEQLIRDGGDEPAFLRYQPVGAPYPFPATICISVNEEVVHGIPSMAKLKEGDIVSLDLGLRHKGLITDAAVTVPVGNVSPIALDLITAT